VAIGSAGGQQPARNRPPGCNDSWTRARALPGERPACGWKHLTTGEEASVRGDSAFNSASVIKIPVMVLAFQMAEKGQLSLAERITINASDFRGGPGSSATTIRGCSRRSAMCCCR
jgi:hypothetical protein